MKKTNVKSHSRSVKGKGNTTVRRHARTVLSKKGKWKSDRKDSGSEFLADEGHRVLKADGGKVKGKTPAERMHNAISEKGMLAFHSPGSPLKISPKDHVAKKVIKGGKDFPMGGTGSVGKMHSIYPTGRKKSIPKKFRKK
jgi:hypothetical protein